MSDPSDDLSLDVAHRDATTIHGSGRVTGVTDRGLVHAPMDLSGTEFASFTNDHGELVRNEGVGNADGTFTVPVPCGARSWELLTTDIFGPVVTVGDARHPTVDHTVLGRLDGVFPTSETDVTFDVTGLAPWGAESTTELVVGNNGGVLFAPEGAGPAPGATTLTSTFDWATAQIQSPLVDASKGDRVVLSQLTQRTTGSEVYQAIAAAGSPAHYTQQDGVASTLSIAMAPTPQKSLGLRWRGDRFKALAAQVGAGAVANGGGAVLDALPEGDRYGFYGFAAPDLAIIFPAAADTDFRMSLDYGNPYRSHDGKPWDEIMSTLYFYSVPVQLGTATPAFVAAGYQSNRSVRQLGGVLEPRIAPPRNIRFTGDQLRWDAPSFGHASTYFVGIYAVSVDASNATNVSFVMGFWTNDRSLRIPEEFVPTGTSFIANIAATDFGDVDPTRDPNSGQPHEQARAVSATFTR